MEQVSTLKHLAAVHRVVLIHVLIQFPLRLFAAVAIPLLQGTDQLVLAAVNGGQVVIGQLPPPLLYFATKLLSLALKHVRVHNPVLSPL